MLLLRQVIVLALLASIGTSQVSSQSASSNVPFSIKGLRAYPYYDKTGEVGPVNLLGPFVGLRNTPIGEGDVGAPSNATLILVDILRPAVPDRRGSVHLTVYELRPRKLLIDSRAALNIFAQKDKVSVPFLVYGTGCTSLEVLAELEGVGGKDGGTAKAVIPFVCGE